MLSKEDAGVLVPKSRPVEMLVGIVDLAIKHGFDIKLDEWQPDRQIFLHGEPDNEMLLDLTMAADFSLQYLEEEMEIGLEIEFTDAGLELLDKVSDWDNLTEDA